MYLKFVLGIIQTVVVQETHILGFNVELCASVALFGHLCILTRTVPLQLVSRVTTERSFDAYIKRACWVNSLLSACLSV